MAKALGRKTPTDFSHVEKYPLTAPMLSALPAPVPVVIGINWYSNFDDPQTDSSGHHWIGRSSRLGYIRGGHCVCLKPRGVTDNTSWWDFYNQGNEGACVGFGWSRCMTLLNRERYFARWLWDMAKSTDEWSDTNPGDDNGTSVRAGGSILSTLGHVAWRKDYAPIDEDYQRRDQLQGTPSKGIKVYRWITSMDDCLTALGYQGLDYVDILNSWGRSYPHLTRLPVTVLERLWREDGEIAIPTDA